MVSNASASAAEKPLLTDAASPLAARRSTSPKVPFPSVHSGGNEPAPAGRVGRIGGPGCKWPADEGCGGNKKIIFNLETINY